MRKPLVAGNWKMNGLSNSVTHLLGELRDAHLTADISDIAIFPPFIYIALAEQLLGGSAISWGAQNVYCAEKGAYTGEVSPAMLQDLQCRYVLVGHSERRHLLGESDDLVAKKCMAALEVGLTPIVCVGETEEQHVADETTEVIEQQILAVAAMEGMTRDLLSQVVIAYEPVWAIGTGKTATPEQAQAVHVQIRELIRNIDENIANGMRILYGGSVNQKNAASLLSMPDIDGALVGGASLDAKQFIEIIQQCNSLY